MEELGGSPQSDGQREEWKQLAESCVPFSSLANPWLIVSRAFSNRYLIDISRLG